MPKYSVAHVTKCKKKCRCETKLQVEENREKNHNGELEPAGKPILVQSKLPKPKIDAQLKLSEKCPNRTLPAKIPT